jgi:hypothetical protein
MDLVGALGTERAVDGQTSLLVRARSSAESRWVEAYRASELGCFAGCRYFDCGVDNCRNVSSVGQPTMSTTKSALEQGDAPDFVEVGEAGIAVDDATRRQRRVQLVG